MKEDVVIVYDCGSTNLRVAAFKSSGDIVAQRTTSNSSKIQYPEKPEWRIWDLDEIWFKLCQLTRDVLKELYEDYRVVGVIVVTWGADGVFVDREGKPTYPAISWQCSRTIESMNEVRGLIDPWEVFKITGYQFISFNTFFKWFWIKRNVPEAIEKAKTFLMIPHYITYKLTGEFFVEPTDASTTMAMDLAKRDWSTEMLCLVSLDHSFFPEWKEPGEIAGYVTEKACNETGLKKGLPVVVGGHDTQFAIFAAGREKNEAILSSGTWEILSFRCPDYIISRDAFENGVVIELDVEKGFWNPQFLMIASAVLEWLGRLVYPEAERRYDLMEEEASQIPSGSDNLILLPSLFPGSGPTYKYNIPGVVLGLRLHTTRAHLYRAALEGLSYQLRLAIELLEKAFRIEFPRITIVGGGSKNELWNTIRANVINREVVVNRFFETTALGAAIVAFKGVGYFRTFNEAIKNIDYRWRIIKPTNYTDSYNRLYKTYLKVYEKLSEII
ncbi:MAG: FGGY family carbohydrate kinase [Candidatus Caldarchaeales archaeon]